MIDDELSEKEDRLIVDALRTVGIEVNGVYDLVNRDDDDYPEAIPVLIGLLPKVRESRVKEGIIRALTVKEARGVAARPLLDEFYRMEDTVFKWAVGNALNIVADWEHVDEILEIVQDRSHGNSRQMFAMALGRFRGRPEIVDVLIDLLDDDDVVAHALDALRRLKAEKARKAAERLLDHPRKLVRREAEKLLSALDREAAKQKQKKAKNQRKKRGK